MSSLVDVLTEVFRQFSQKTLGPSKARKETLSWLKGRARGTLVIHLGYASR